MVENRIIKNVEDIVQYIDEVMKKRKISRSFVEDGTYLSQGLFSRWVKGTSKPSIDRIIDILNFMKIEMILQVDIESEMDDDNKTCPKFLDHSDVILDSKLLEQKIKERLNYELEGTIARILKDVLFSENITLKEKKKIHQMLGYLIAVEEMKEM